MKHVYEQLWTDVKRTPVQLAEIARNYTEWAEPPSGYPALRAGGEGERLFLTAEEIAERTSYATVFGRRVRILDLPGGHDALKSAERRATLSNPNVLANLLYEPDPEFETADTSKGFMDDSRRMGRWIGQGCRTFTTQGRPLIPGIDQLLQLRTEGVTGERLGMATAMGSYVAHGLFDMGDAVTAYEHPDGKVDVLLNGRPEDGVWGLQGGFGTREDLDGRGRFSPAKCALRRCVREVDLDISDVRTMPLPTDLPVSGRTTASAGLIARPTLVLVNRSQYERYGRIRPGDEVRDAAGWVGMPELLEMNGDARDGLIRPGSTIPVWTTHMRYIANAADRLTVSYS